MSNKFTHQNGLWIIITFIGILAGGKAGAQGMDPDFPCLNPQSAEFCKFKENSKQLECKEDIICNGTDVNSGSAPEEAASTQGTVSPLAVPCTSIEDRAGNYGDTIYIGAVYYYGGGVWYTNGEFGYCNVSTGGIPVVCSSVTNPLPVRLYAGNDTAGTVDVRQTCLTNAYGIGPWTDLTSYWQNQKIKLNMYGCQGEDLLRGGPNNDKLIGGSNTNSGVGDTIYGLAGNDIVCGDYGTVSACNVGTNCSSDSGSVGKDTLAGGYGDDDIWGGGGDDTVEYQTPWDTGKNFVNGGPGYDTIYGGNGDDKLFGGDHTDTIWGYGGNDLLSGCNGSDFVYGGNGQDTINEKLCYYDRGGLSNPVQTNDGDDTLRGYGPGSNTTDDCDIIRGFLGGDQIYLDGIYTSCQMDIAYGGSGTDAIYGGAAPVNWIAGDYYPGNWDPDDTGPAGGDYIEGGNGPDWIYCGWGPYNIVHAGWGDDHIYGSDYPGPIADSIFAGPGCDEVWGGDGNDSIFLNEVPATYDDECETFNEAHGGDGNDSITGSNRVDHMWGDDGSDGIYGREGDDFICSGCDDDLTEGGDYCGGIGNDRIVVFSVGQIQSTFLLNGDGDEAGSGPHGDDRVCYLGDGQANEIRVWGNVPDGYGDYDCCECKYSEACTIYEDTCEIVYDWTSPPGSSCNCIPEGLTCTCP